MSSIPALSFIALLFSIVLHEIAHGYAARFLGDPTAENEGRLTINPLSHIDLFGSILIPLALTLSGAPAFGWAKPVPYNPSLFRKWHRFGHIFVAFVGPATNIALATIFSLIAWTLALWGNPSLEILYTASQVMVIINIALTLFNLFPLPPLDGSKIWTLLPGRATYILWQIERYWLIYFAIYAFVIWPKLSPLVFTLANLLLP